MGLKVPGKTECRWRGGKSINQQPSGQISLSTVNKSACFQIVLQTYGAGSKNGPGKQQRIYFTFSRQKSAEDPTQTQTVLSHISSATSVILDNSTGWRLHTLGFYVCCQAGFRLFKFPVRISYGQIISHKKRNGSVTRLNALLFEKLFQHTIKNSKDSNWTVFFRRRQSLLYN